MTTVLLIRHGDNSMVGKRLAGRLPGVHLNKNGKKQAQQLAEALCKAPIKAIYSSPLERAVETAEPLAKALNLPIQIASGLIELDYGEWQGKTLKQLGRRKLWKVVQEKPSEMRFPQGESFEEVRRRAAAEIDRIVAAHEEKDLVACFSHGDVIRLLLAHYLGMPLDLFQRVAASTASISVIHFDKKARPHILHMNQVLTLEFKQEQPDPAGGKTEIAGDAAPVEEAAREAAQEAEQIVEDRANHSRKDGGSVK
ncbi:MAG: MSMEG_4193 family putative phosphomutase [Chloroflexi bacterium]|nr:MSMEG_4193 family putative phosphomutase [Chloroflexota bacterium]